MSEGKVPDFNFICGIFRSREAGLLSAARLEGLTAARDFAEALAQLPEGRFAAEARKDPGASAIEAGFRAAVAELKDLVVKYSPRSELNDLAFLPWDFHNLKAALLQKLTGKTVEGLFGPEGSVTVAAVTGMAEAMRFDSLPKPLAVSLEKALVAYYEVGKDAQAFEISLDRQKSLRMLETAASATAPVLAYYRIADDAAIAEAFVRSHLARVPWEIVQGAFSGHPDASRLKEMYPLKPAEWGARLASVSREPVRILLSAAAAASDPAAPLLDQRRRVLAIMKDWRYRPPSFEYALYYVTRTLADLANLRLVLVCKLNRIADGEIGKRVIDAFV
jgi:vacuolar-type H+-ATPase subunit C/Vma6